MTDLPSTAADVIAQARELLAAIVQVGAPTGGEAVRAAWIARWLREQGVGNVEIDEVHNVTVRLGPEEGRPLLIDAHTDTVFDDERPPLTKTATRWCAPGIMDNTAACALLMCWAAQVGSGLVALPRPVLLSFSVGEEGQGDLRGVKHLSQVWRDRPTAALVLDLGLEEVSRVCVGSDRMQVTIGCRGGHSWNDFGDPTAIHAACRWIADLEKVAPWSRNRLSYNVGILRGGDRITTLAATAEVSLDLRSIDPALLAEAKEAVLRSLHTAAPASAYSVRVEPVGFRPAGALPETHALLAALQETHRELDLPLTERPLSTNANWFIHQGVPSLCTGIVRGAGYHSREEYIEVASLAQGWQKLTRLVDRLLNCQCEAM
ncbi:M20/M25/M40 family metallo-hydrolase [Phycisphaerales bacterium AB-hyl4]|uniref:M20/M25/M40 family metallo-hydrolase n=1 Tax=Natronomicrosphaera hydrolytica TaxID=3242702 RepID=A0ABV4U681_9BACT